MSSSFSCTKSADIRELFTPRSPNSGCIESSSCNAYICAYSSIIYLSKLCMRRMSKLLNNVNNTKK